MRIKKIMMVGLLWAILLPSALAAKVQPAFPDQAPVQSVAPANDQSSLAKKIADTQQTDKIPSIGK